MTAAEFDNAMRADLSGVRRIARERLDSARREVESVDRRVESNPLDPFARADKGMAVDRVRCALDVADEVGAL